MVLPWENGAKGKACTALGTDSVEDSVVLGIQNIVWKAGGTGPRTPESPTQMGLHPLTGLCPWPSGQGTTSPTGEEWGQRRDRAWPSKARTGAVLSCV